MALRKTAGPTASKNAAIPLTSRLSLPGVAPIALLVLFLGAYIAVMLAGEDFSGYDNSQFTLYSLRGIDLPTPIWRESGRFFPLGFQQFNLVGRMNRSVAAYHAIPICQLLALAAILMVVGDGISVAKRAALSAFALFLPSVALTLSALIYTESDVVFWLACMALGVHRFARTRSIGWALAAVLSAQFALYAKEPVFLFVLTFAVIRMLMRARNYNSLRETFRDPEARLDTAIAATAVMYCVYYAVVILSDTRLGYLVLARRTPLETLRWYLQLDWLIWILAGAISVRMYRVLRGRAAPELLWDGLACGASIYFIAYLCMGMVNNYYLAPADLFAAVYLGRRLFLSWGTMQPPARVVSSGLALLVIVQSLDLSALYLVERKYVVQRKSLIATIILDSASANRGRVTRLYFPFTPPYGLSEFAAYLSYRGVPVETEGHASRDGSIVELSGSKIGQTGRCVAIRDFICRAASPGENDLTVVLPDDTYTMAESKQYRALEHELLARDAQERAHGRFFRTLDFVWKWASLVGLRAT
jgi:hypothetical protein